MATLLRIDLPLCPTVTPDACMYKPLLVRSGTDPCEVFTPSGERIAVLAAGGAEIFFVWAEREPGVWGWEPESSRMTPREAVLAFHRKMGLPVHPEPGVPDGARVRVRLRLMTEEFFETLVAAFPSHVVRDRQLSSMRDRLDDLVRYADLDVNFPAFVDGLVDLGYINEGTMLEFGVDSEEALAVVHRANMTKSPAFTREGKIVKPPGFLPPDMGAELARQGKRRGSLPPGE